VIRRKPQRHRSCILRQIWKISVSVYQEGIETRKTYPKASEAGIPSTGKVRIDRSVTVRTSNSIYSDRIDVLSANTPDSRVANRKRESAI
jgi:hypothetical protein